MSVRSLGFTAVLALAAAGALVASPAAASIAGTTGSGSFFINYDITLPNFAVTNLVLFEQGAPNPNPNGYGITFGGCCEIAGIGETIITDPFLKTNPIINNFLLGVTTGLPGDADGQQHLVVFTNDSFANSAQTIAFGTLFPDTLEDRLITDITTNLDEAAVGETVFNQAINDLFTFAAGDAVNGPNGSIGFGSHDTFSVVAFSDGQTIGTGQAFTTPGPAPVPEPASWALMIGGFGLAGAVLRRRKSVAA